MNQNLYFRGSVNRWECDENDHLNVRFFVEKHWQSVCAAAAFIGLPEVSSPDDYIRALQTQHIRFLAEARLSTPISGYVRVVGVGSRQVEVLSELRHSQSQAVLSACIHTLALAITTPSSLEPVPQHAQPRGILPADLPHAALSLAHALKHGFFTVGKGMATSEECTPAADLRIHHYMGRVSDAMPHLWARFEQWDPATDPAEGALVEEGGAVLEYRMHYHQPLRCGDTFEIVSGVRDVGAKVQQFAHLMYHTGTGDIAVSAQAAAVRMDLQQRRAIALPESRLAALRRQLITKLEN
ncbi:MAG: acyl-CoA thioesterase [bacterium]